MGNMKEMVERHCGLVETPALLYGNLKTLCVYLAMGTYFKPGKDKAAKGE